MASIKGIARTVSAARWEVLRAVLYFVALLVITTVGGYLLTGSLVAGIGAIVAVFLISYMVHTITNFANGANPQNDFSEDTKRHTARATTPERDTGESTSTKQDAVSRFRQQYMQGEIDIDEFENRLDEQFGMKSGGSATNQHEEPQLSERS